MIERNEAVLLKRIGHMTDATSVEEYCALGGYAGLKKAVQMHPEEILSELDQALLRGRGGAAYPLGKKWQHLYHIQGEPKYIVCNADEGEPGTFKDRVLLEKDPLSIIEGMTIAGFVFGSNDGYIYIRGEYREIQKTFEQALQHAEESGYLGKNILGISGFDYQIHIVSGAGAYVCGENSALLNSIEGKAGRPRIKPPHLAEVGLYGKPTLVNNVESFASVPVIVEHGGQAYLDLGMPDGGGTKLICLSGHIKNRGTYEVNLGTSLKSILYDEAYGGGISTGNEIGFIHFGGQSGPIGFPEDFSIPYSYQGLWDQDLAIGSGAIVVMDETVDVIEYLQNVMGFFVHESCGKCTPCRLGTTRLLELLMKFTSGKATLADLNQLKEAVQHVTYLSACGLGQSCGVAINSVMKKRPEIFEERVKVRRAFV